MHRALFLADGPSDMPLSDHLEQLSRRTGLLLEVVPLDPHRVPAAGRTIEGRVKAALAQDSDFDCVLVHRDAEKQDPERRFEEVRDGVNAAGFSGPAVGIVPVKMTEAWLLLDEQAIRRVAGHPSGTADLGLPKPRHVEGVAHPKAMLQDALITASGASGRRLRVLKKRFGAHRRQLLEALDLDGPIEHLAAWQRLKNDVSDLAAQLVRN